MNGGIREDDENLKRITKWRPNNIHYSNPVQTDYSVFTNSLYTACDGTETMRGLSIENQSKKQLRSGFIEVTPIKSSSAVSVSPDGCAVAYGYPDGHIVIRNAINLDVWGSFRCISEPIKAIFITL